MRPAGGFLDRARLAIGFVKLGVSAIGIGLEDTGIVGQMRPGMFAGSIARVVKHRRRRYRTAERAIVAHINPTSSGVGLALGQNRNGSVVAVQAFGREDVRFQTPQQRFERRAAGPDLVGQGRQAEWNALLGVAFGLAVERLMLPELLEQDHRQQAGAGPASGNHMERRRGLADLLAVPAAKLLADMLDHLPLARDRFQRLGDVLAELAKPPTATALASGRAWHDHPLTRQMIGEGLARRTIAGEGRHRRGLGHRSLGGDLVGGGRTLQLLEAQLDLIHQPRAAFRTRAIKLARQLRDVQFLVRDQGLVVGGLGPGHREFRFDVGGPSRFDNQRRLQRLDVVRNGERPRTHAPDRITNPRL